MVHSRSLPIAFTGEKNFPFGCAFTARVCVAVTLASCACAIHSDSFEVHLFLFFFISLVCLFLSLSLSLSLLHSFGSVSLAVLFGDVGETSNPMGHVIVARLGCLALSRRHRPQCVLI